MKVAARASPPVLAQALEAARKAKAVLVVAKLDRLARDAELVNRLSREVAGNGFPGFLFADLPDVDATNATDRMVLGVMAQVAQLEERREGGRPWRRGSQSSARTKRRTLDRAEALRGLIAPLVDAGQSRRAIAAALNDAGHRTERGSLWNHTTVGRVIERLAL